MLRQRAICGSLRPRGGVSGARMALQYTAPNARLARELRQVAAESARVAEVLRGINHMPQAFPIEALQEICYAMAQLHKGTAEGCNMPLTYARHMLPLLRRDHFYIEGEQPETLSEDAAIFLRDEPLDAAIMRLYGAVGTALDEYRAQAQETYDDTVGPEEIITFGAGGEFAEINGLAQEVVQNTDSAGVEFANLKNLPATKPADDFARLLQDGSSAGHTVQSQIRIRPLIARYYDAAAKAVAKIPDALDKAGDALILGTDVTKIWMEEFSAFNKRIRLGLYDSLHGFANALKATGARLKQAQGAGQPTARQDDPDVASAEALIKELLQSGTPLPQDLAEKVRVLEFGDGSGSPYVYIKRSEDLLLLKNIHSLSGISINDVYHLRNLKKLKILTVKASSALDLYSIDKLSDLTTLTILVDSAHNLSPLGELTGITSLRISADSALDLTPLGRLQALTNLTVKAEIAQYISPLGTLSGLINLNLHVPSARDLAPLGELTKLNSLTLSAHSALDLAPLAKLTGLTSLTVTAGSSPDLGPLGQLTGLTSLDLKALNATDLAPLKKLTGLISLEIWLQKEELSPLATLHKLETLTINNARQLDLAPLAWLPQLKKLTLRGVTYKGQHKLGPNVELVLQNGSKPA